MVFPNKYLIKDVEGLPAGFCLMFEKKLKPELICCACDALTPKGLKDRKGHIYCQACVAAHTNRFNQFTCSLSGCKANKDDMQSSEKEWDSLRKMNTACPNEDKMCRFKGALEDVLQHYKTCGHQGKVRCSLCDCLQDRKTLAAHMTSDCPRRVVECCFCLGDVEACSKLNHEMSCRKRPASCQHCRKQFNTLAELEDEHYPQCPQFPVNCAFEKLGCKFSGARRDVAVHETTSKHTAMLVDQVHHLKEENKMLRGSLQKQGEEYGEQAKKFMNFLAQLQGEIQRLQNHSVQMETKLKAQEQQLQAQSNKNAQDKRVVQAFMTDTEQAVGFLKRELYLGPRQSVFEHAWKLHPYSDLKRSAVMSSNRSLSSGVLSINKPGYNVELVVAVSRAGGGVMSSPHLALKIRIHKGDYDDLLPWPFANKIRVVLVNHYDEAESRRFELDPSDAAHAAACMKRPAENQLNPMFGYSQLIPIPLLENERKGFLFRNCVILKFSVLAHD